MADHSHAKTHCKQESVPGIVRVFRPRPGPAGLAEKSLLSGEPVAGIMRRPVILAAMCLGISAVVTQLLMLREALAVFGGNELIIGLLLGVWLLWTGIGALLGGWPAAGPRGRGWCACFSALPSCPPRN